VFPLFVTLSGCGMAFAYRNGVRWAVVIRRSAVLLLCGLLYNTVAAGSTDLGTLRFAGPLQVYAVLVLVVGLLHLVVRRPVGWAVLTLALAAAQLTLLHLWQQHCPHDALTMTCNPSGTIDRWWMGADHMYRLGASGHDPEGLVGILGALVTAFVGTTAGHLMLARRGSWRVLPTLLGWAVVVGTAAVAADQLVPAFKRLWTTPFALGVAALGVVGLALGLALLDLPARRGWQRLRERLAWPVVAFGRNSLLVYFGSHLVMIVLLQRGTPAWAVQAAERLDFLGHPRTSFSLVVLACWTLLATALHARRIYVRP
jgi:predicted acyltransferase